MGFSTVLSAGMKGLLTEFVHVEADVSNGLPMIHMVGYLSSEVKEAAERVRTALKNSGISIPAKKIVINLSPATVKKRGAAFDLPIAVSILISLGMLEKDAVKETLVIGELSLDGRIQKVTGVLPIAAEAQGNGIKKCIVPSGNAAEGALVDGITIIGADHLFQVYQHLSGKKLIESAVSSKTEIVQAHDLLPDYSEIKGQQPAKRAVEVAVAGGHNILLIGPPGSGKSMIASRIPSILPPVTAKESMEITKIYSVAGLLDKEQPLITRRPFRSVHHTVTKAALIGGGLYPMPGEISFSHAGVLFLDELTEFSKPVLEVLRQPLEERRIRISRSHGNYLFPADVILACAMNPCPCGNYPDYNKCTCTAHQVHNYLGKISQPFLDRLDICIEVPKVSYESLTSQKKQESSEKIRERVIKARELQYERYKGTDIRWNASLDTAGVTQYCELGKEERALMKQAFTSFELTARTYHKILKTARTIADLGGSRHIAKAHIKEAIGYRTPDKKYWGGGL